MAYKLIFKYNYFDKIHRRYFIRLKFIIVFLNEYDFRFLDSRVAVRIAILVLAI